MRYYPALLGLALCACTKAPAPVYLTAPTPPPPAPASYDDCVLLSMKPGLNNMATEAVLEACRSKFPDAKAKGLPPNFDPDDPYADLIPAPASSGAVDTASSGSATP